MLLASMSSSPESNVIDSMICGRSLRFNKTQIGGDSTQFGSFNFEIKR